MANAHVTNFARIDFRNDDRMFGIKDEDRFSHIYIIGKTGTGKSTLVETMALQDIERGHGCAVIDPHGDLVERIAACTSRSGRTDVIYFNAADPLQPYGYNPLRQVRAEFRTLAASGVRGAKVVVIRVIELWRG
jgi:type IV secretory pathway TraG/TraD family ATPase VirD4